MTGDVKTLLPQGFHQIGVELLEQLGIERRGQITDLTSLQTAKMIMGIAPAIVPSGAFGVRKLGGQAGVHESFQRFVDRGQADVRKVPAHGGIDLISRRVQVHRAQVSKHGGPLTREAPTRLFQSVAEIHVPEFRRCRLRVYCTHCTVKVGTAVGSVKSVSQALDRRASA
jgi:hypothetical protein